jgi:teichuronic acid biosynthesis glycosyltransferase TuaG
MFPAQTPDTGQPLVSVVVPTHKRLRYLAETVRTILAQRYSTLELVVVADGHDQDVADLVSRLKDPRAKYLASPFAGRPAVPRNFGIRQAQGEFIAFCDDDDLWHEDKLDSQMTLMIEDRLDFTFTACRNIDQDGNPLRGPLLNSHERVKKAGFLFSLGTLISNSSIVVSRSLLDRSGLFDEAPGLRAVEDYEICSRLLIHTDAVGIREPLVEYRNHVQSIQPRAISGWMRTQANIQSAILANGSATKLLWAARYLRVVYWATRVLASRLVNKENARPL